MSANDPQPGPRRKKLVLRKIADSPARTPSATATSDSGPQPRTAVATNAYTDRLSTSRSPAQTPLPRKASFARESPLNAESGRTLGTPQPVRAPSLRARMEIAPDDVEPETQRECEEVEPEQAEVIADHSARDVYANRPWAEAADHWWSPEAGALAAMTPAAPNARGTTLGTADPAWSPVPIQASAPPAAPLAHAFPGPVTRVAAYGSPRDSTPRPSDAPVVASLPPVAAAPQLEPMRRPRLSADSKLLAAGGALAAAMLLVAVGVLLGQRSSSSATPAAAATVQSPVVVEVKAPTAVALPTAATAIEARPSLPERPLPAVAKSEGPASIDVQQLPSASRSHAQGWSVATPAAKATASGGWVATPPVRSATAAGADTAAEEPATGDPPSAASTTAAAAEQQAPAPSASAAPPVDPFVQAVREDIREDEARTK